MNKKILVIDDNKILCKKIEIELSSSNLEATSVYDGIEALEYLKKYQVDLIITDLMMPNISGNELVKIFRNDMKLTCPIIVLTSDENDESVIEVLSNGANEYLVKPIGINQLKLRCYKLLNISLSELNIKPEDNKMLNARSLGIEIPCYNEKKRLSKNEFQSFINKNSSYHLCFVNDGSKDKTLEILNNFEQERIGNIFVLNLEKNSGKAEAVRQGILFLHEKKNYDYIGF